MKIKILSNGNPYETKIVNAETGEPVEGVAEINWRLDPKGSELRLVLCRYEVELEGEFPSDALVARVGPREMRDWVP